MFKGTQTATRIIALLVCVLFISLSIGAASPYFSSPQTYDDIIEKLDEKKTTASNMTTAITIVSFGLSALKDDTATPIAEEIANLTGPLLLITCILYAEKFLLTTTGYISFTFLIPLACVLIVISMFTPKRNIRNLAYKILIFAIAIVLLVPASVQLTVMVEETFESSIKNAIDRASNLAKEIITVNASEGANFFIKFIEGIGDSVTFILDTGKNVLSLFIDALAVMLITTCAIPVFTFLAFAWIINKLFNVQFNLPPKEKLPNLPHTIDRFTPKQKFDYSSERD